MESDQITEGALVRPKGKLAGEITKLFREGVASQGGIRFSKQARMFYKRGRRSTVERLREEGKGAMGSCRRRTTETENGKGLER